MIFYLTYFGISFLFYTTLLLPRYFMNRNSNRNQYVSERFSKFAKKYYDDIKDENKVEVEIQKNIDKTNKIANTFFFISLIMIIAGFTIDIATNGILHKSEILRYLLFLGVPINAFSLETIMARYFDRKNGNIRIKDRKYNFANDDITIRSVRNSDFSFYKHWYKESHINKESIGKLTEKEIERMLYYESVMNYIFIITIKEKNYGEIVLNKNNSLIIKMDEYKKPFYNLWTNYYEKLSNSKIGEILNLFIYSLKESNLKIGSLIVTIKERNDENYISNEFSRIEKKYYEDRMEKIYLKKDIKKSNSEEEIWIRNL